jgi:hypothetical protein
VKEKGMNKKQTVRVVKRVERERKQEADAATQVTIREAIENPKRESVAIVSEWVREFQKKKKEAQNNIYGQASESIFAR